MIFILFQDIKLNFFQQQYYNLHIFSTILEILNLKHYYSFNEVMSKSKSITIMKLIDAIFIVSSIIFNIFVSILYIMTKLGNMEIVRVIGFIILLLIIPFTMTLIGYIKEKEEKKVIISLVVILLYFFLEILLDYILIVPFREILALHILYIIVFYVADFSMIGVTFDKNKKMGFVVLVTFFILLGCLIYMYV